VPINLRVRVVTHSSTRILFPADRCRRRQEDDDLAASHQPDDDSPLFADAGPLESRPFIYA